MGFNIPPPLCLIFSCGLVLTPFSYQNLPYICCFRYTCPAFRPHNYFSLKYRNWDAKHKFWRFPYSNLLHYSVTLWFVYFPSVIFTAFIKRLIFIMQTRCVLRVCDITSSEYLDNIHVLNPVWATGQAGSQCIAHHILQYSKLASVQAMKTHKGSRGIAPLILNTVPGGQWSASRPCRCQLLVTLGAPQRWSRRSGLQFTACSPVEPWVYWNRRHDSWGTWVTEKNIVKYGPRTDDIQAASY